MRRRRRLGLDRPSSTIIAEDIEHLNKDLQRGHYFFTDIKTEGVLLFDNGRHTLVEACPLDPAEYQKYAREDFEHWFTSACGFARMYEAAMEIENNNIAAFQRRPGRRGWRQTPVLAHHNGGGLPGQRRLLQ